MSARGHLQDSSLLLATYRDQRRCYLLEQRVVNYVLIKAYEHILNLHIYYKLSNRTYRLL